MRRAAPPTSLSRLLSPESVAVVGASEKRLMSEVAVGQLLDARVDLHLVNPRGGEAYGRPMVRDLTEIGKPVDAVLSLVSAERSVAVVEEAGRLGCGGVVVVASGFAEAGEPGRALQSRLVEAAARDGLAVCGPNCTGFSNVTEGVSLFTGTPVGGPAGGISLVSSSGYLMRSAMVAARERNLGLRLAISAGNEAVTTLVDYLEFLIDDPATAVIALVTEKIREPEAFFAAAARAAEAGKPLVVLKLGRSERARDIVRSHTGVLTGASWVYDVAFRSAGIIDARDIDDLLDRVAMLAQLPARRWRPVRRIAVLASSGGVAALACDTLADEGIDLPSLDAVGERVRAIIPGAAVVNPLDLTGFAMSDPTALTTVLETYRDSDEVDAVVVCWWIGPQDEHRAAMLLDPARQVAAGGAKPFILASVEDSRIGAWTTAAVAVDAVTPAVGPAIDADAAAEEAAAVDAALAAGVEATAVTADGAGTDGAAGAAGKEVETGGAVEAVVNGKRAAGSASAGGVVVAGRAGTDGVAAGGPIRTGGVVVSGPATVGGAAVAAPAGADAVVFGRGLRGTVRGLVGMDRYVSAKPWKRPARLVGDPIARPKEIVRSEAGPILSFAASMRLLAAAGIPVAPWTVLETPGAWQPGGLPGAAGPLAHGAWTAGPLVVKLADVPHRTELGAVRLDVHPDAVADVAAELMALAEARSLPRTVAVQARVSGEGEAFLGYEADTDLGPVAVVGLGGVLVELTRAVVGRLLPFADDDVEEMLDELGRDTVFRGLRGGRAWDRQAIAAALRALADLGARTTDWLTSIDINPLICAGVGATAVDALILVKD